jgi:hypothetical protein
VQGVQSTRHPRLYLIHSVIALRQNVYQPDCYRPARMVIRVMSKKEKKKKKWRKGSKG